MAEEHGQQYFGREHRVIFLPPYHPEYNAIEMAWGRVKHYVGQNPPYNLKILMQETLPDALRNITHETTFNIVKHIRELIKTDANNELDMAEIDERMQGYEFYE